jgi:hypothetical protein
MMVGYSKVMSDISLPNLYFDRVVAYLGAVYPQIHRPDQSLPLLVVTKGSAAVVVEVTRWAENNIKIPIWTYVVTEPKLDPALLKFLLRQNELLRFGGFSLDSDGDIRLHACIYGTDFSPSEVQLVVREVLEAADYYDDEIILIWGGKRAIDHVSRISLPLPS